jgi:hypothetical protein
MPEDNRNWFISERSEALASLLLTSRPDLSVRKENNQDDGVDFVVALRETENVLPTKLFVVQVKGTLSSDQGEWTENVKQLYKHGGHFYLPVCVFVVNVRNNDAAYAWLAEPQTKAGSVALNFFEHPDFHALDNAAVDQIVDRVRAWYDAMPHSTAANAS